MNLERKVRQLDNDVQSIYELLAAIQGVQLRQTNRLDEMDRSIEAVATRLDAMETRLDAMESRLGAVDTRLESLEGLLKQVLELLRSGSN